MRPAMPLAAACAVAFLSAAGCGDKVVPKATSGTATPDAAPKVAPDAAPKVAPDVPKTAVSPTPVPGQANDHSSPTFKGGGKDDKTK